MVYLKLVEDASPYYDDIDPLVAANKDDFIVPEAYYDGPAEVPPEERPVPEGFLDNYRNEDEHKLLAYTEEDELVGIMSFEFNATRADFPLDDPCVYLSLAIVAEGHRDKGVGTQMVNFLLSEVFAEHLSGEEEILVKTWSTNDRQRHVLSKFGFSLIEREQDARGEGIDSIWLTKPIPSEYTE